jgi:hypothetical protein
MEEFETLREQFIARGEKLVSDLIGQQVNFSNSPEDFPPSEELINSFQQSAQDTIAAVIANFTGGETAETPETAEQSITTQETLVGAGIEQFFANLDNDSLTNPSEGSTDSNSQVKFEPSSDSSFGGQVTLNIDGQTLGFTVGGNPFSGDSNPFAGDNSSTGSDNSFGGGSPFGSGSPFGGGNTFGGGMFA